MWLAGASSGRKVTWCVKPGPPTTSSDADARVIDNILKHGVTVDGERFLLDAGWKSPLVERDMLKTLPGDKVDWCGRYWSNGAYELKN